MTYAPLESFFERLRTGGKGMLMTDYDGTLAPFRADRRKAFPYVKMVSRLCKLSAGRNLRLIIISGRTIRDLRQLLRAIKPLPELWGSHGLERLLPDGTYWKAPFDRDSQRIVEKAYRHCHSLEEKSRCEKKLFGIAFHTRGMSAPWKMKRQQRMQREWEEICRGSQLAVFSFDGGVELREKNANKKDAVRTILQEHPSEGAIAYLGDDATDEDAFKALGRRGLSILVRAKPRPTRADVHLTTPGEVIAFFDRCLALLDAG